MLLTDGQNRVLFHPPQVNSGGHGFRQRIDLVGGPFQGSIDDSSYEGLGALRGFHRQLVTLYDTLQGETRLPNTYYYLKLSLTGDGRGHIAVRVEVFHPTDVQLSFGFAMDQTELPAVIAAVERLFLSAAGPE